MTMQQLQYFLTAARNLNFTKTAETFFISQSAVTQQMKNLEQELEVTLFSRENKKLSLTDAGKLFVTEAEGIISRIHDSIEKVQAVQNGKSGRLSIGYLQCMEMSRFPKSIQNFHSKYPGVRLDLKRDSAVALHDDFLRGKYDLIFNIEHDLLTYTNIQKRQIGKYPFYAVMSPDHRLADRKMIRQEDLQFEKLIVHDFHRGIPESPNMVPRRYLNEDLLPSIIKTVEDVETILIMVASGIGIGILPDFDIRKPQINLNLVYIPLDTGGYMETLSVIHSENNPNPLILLFLAEV